MKTRLRSGVRAALLALSGGAAALAPTGATALEFECSQPGDIRLLRMEIPGEDHLCEVSVTGESGAGERRVLWHADNETLFCSAKTYELRDRYTEDFGFDCFPWPDRDGVDRLSARQRSILDTELKALIGRGQGAQPAFTVDGVRAAASTSLDGREGLLALQFFLSDGTDPVRLIADEGAERRVLAETRALAASVEPTGPLRVDTALIDSIGAGGTLEVTTLLVASDAPPAEGGGAPCEGRQTFRASADGTLSPSGSHRHVCTDDGTGDDTDGGTGDGAG